MRRRPDPQRRARKIGDGGGVKGSRAGLMFAPLVRSADQSASAPKSGRGSIPTTSAGLTRLRATRTGAKGEKTSGRRGERPGRSTLSAGGQGWDGGDGPRFVAAVLRAWECQPSGRRREGTSSAALGWGPVGPVVLEREPGVRFARRARVTVR